MRTKLFVSLLALGLAFTAAIPLAAEYFFYPGERSTSERIGSSDTDQASKGEDTAATDTEAAPKPEAPGGDGNTASQGGSTAEGEAQSITRELAGDTPCEITGDDSKIRVKLADSGDIAEMTLGEYVCGTVAAEIPATFAPEALKAQAVAARTYCLYRLFSSEGHEDAAVCTDHTHCAAFITKAELASAIGAERAEKVFSAAGDAVSSTSGEVLIYDGEYALTAFHASSDGYTEDAAQVWAESVPYLISVSSPEEARVTERAFTPAELIEKLELPDGAGSTLASSPDEAIRLGSNSSGRVSDAWICGRIFSGTELRARLSLPSAKISVAYTDGKFVFTASGSGHGVGMSQYGADTMADRGKSYAEILSHYYQGTELVSLGRAGE